MTSDAAHSPAPAPKRRGRLSVRRELVEREIKENAARLFAERGVAGTTLQDIADATGLTRQAVYHYVANKDALFAQLVTEIADQPAQVLHEINSRDDLGPADKLRRMAHSLALHQMANPDRFRLMIRSESDLPEHLATSYAASRRRVLKELVEVIDAGVAAGTFRTVNARTAALGIIGMLNWIAWWYQDGTGADTYVADDLAEMAVRTVQSVDRDPPPSTVAAILANVRRELDMIQRLSGDTNLPPRNN
ncbi:TetR family transcriptional regulator [Gordonia paraffinivorans]|uniref:HTH-type transcriptional repressor KstR2 n=1 Tax=Gordonia paraffinivorans TaxID=175628 RepID=A0ABD7V3E7_9ACTN|nr:TetR family transcriptional regulator [Gordonia paraffinivorans]VFA88776.1 HTH-type transcriptional repressor KstR2 [Gordonia paraffinivorans]